MRGGGIYSEERCFICGARLKDNFKDACACPAHPQVKATKLRIHFKGVKKRFKTYADAWEFLNGLRFRDSEGDFDVRDYQRANPLGFENMALKWLEYRKVEVKAFRGIRNHIGKAIIFFANRNIKSIQFGDLEDFLQSLPKILSSKTKKNYFTTLHAFFVWACKREKKLEMPEFPHIDFQLKWRKTVDKGTQNKIIQEVKNISYHINPKIWIGVKWLATYIPIRPKELINIREGDFDLSVGVVNIRENKEQKPKIVPLLHEDIEIIKSFPPALPHLYFFRHGKRKGVALKHRGKFGKHYLYTWWKRACKNLGVDVDLYGGTRHSSARDLRKHFTPDQIKKYGTQHSTTKAFNRYFEIELEDSREVFRKTQGGKEVGKLFDLKKKGKLLNS